MKVYGLYRTNFLSPLSLSLTPPSLFSSLSLLSLTSFPLSSLISLSPGTHPCGFNFFHTFYHVYIKNGLEQISKDEVSVLEIGFGTGLNCFITFLEANKKVNYVGVEAYPVTPEEVKGMNYVAELKALEHKAIFNKLHEVSWGEEHTIIDGFQLTKRKQFFQDICVI